jgi:ankyrin repeat protein
MANPNHEVLRVLIEAGADVNAIDVRGERALDYSKKNKHLEGSKALKILREMTEQRQKN